MPGPRHTGSTTNNDIVQATIAVCIGKLNILGTDADWAIRDQVRDVPGWRVSSPIPPHHDSSFVADIEVVIQAVTVQAMCFVSQPM